MPRQAPIVRLPRGVYTDVVLYLSRGWNKGLIVTMILARHGCRIPQACIRAIKEGRSCSSTCGESCPVLDTMPAEE